VLIAAPPALWNGEGNGNDAIYGLPFLCLPLTFGYHSPSEDKNGGST
jgi:hypothetical protein